jgi:hypothetical protein
MEEIRLEEIAESFVEANLKDHSVMVMSLDTDIENT